jgi:hypothetical protein
MGGLGDEFLNANIAIEEFPSPRRIPTCAP